MKCVSSAHDAGDAPEATVSGKFSAPSWKPGRFIRVHYCETCADRGVMIQTFIPDPVKVTE